MHAGMACAKWDDSYFWNKIKASKRLPNPAINENLLTAHRIYKVDLKFTGESTTIVSLQ
jgi:hypothetical protein